MASRSSWHGSSANLDGLRPSDDCRVPNLRALLATLILLAIQQSATGRVEILVRDRNTVEGISGVPVSLALQARNQPPRPADTAFTDSRGVAAFPALSVGGYTIKIGEIYQGQ